MRFQTKIKRARFNTSGLKVGDMIKIGEDMIEQIQSRLARAQTTEDTDAPPLKPRYAKEKAKTNYSAIRDLYKTGRLYRSMKVLEATMNKAVLGMADEASRRRLFFNQRRSRQWGLSPSDRAKFLALAHERLAYYAAQKKV